MTDRFGVEPTTEETAVIAAVGDRLDNRLARPTSPRDRADKLTSSEMLPLLPRKPSSEYRQSPRRDVPATAIARV